METDTRQCVKSGTPDDREKPALPKREVLYQLAMKKSAEIKAGIDQDSDRFHGPSSKSRG